MDQFWGMTSLGVFLLVNWVGLSVLFVAVKE